MQARTQAPALRAIVTARPKVRTPPYPPPPGRVRTAEWLQVLGFSVVGTGREPVSACSRPGQVRPSYFSREPPFCARWRNAVGLPYSGECGSDVDAVKDVACREPALSLLLLLQLLPPPPPPLLLLPAELPGVSFPCSGYPAPRRLPRVLAPHGPASPGEQKRSPLALSCSRRMNQEG